MKGLKGTLSLVLLLWGIFSFTLVFGQSNKTAPQQRTPQYDAAAVVKLVTVRVLDEDGRPKTDLKKENFILYDNGEKKDITEFEVHIISEEGMEIRPSGQVSELAGAASALNRRLFIFLDIQGSDVNGMANAKEAALHFVDTQLRPGDEVGIIGFSRMSGFFVKEYLTTDYERIREAIKKTKEIRQSGASSSGGELIMEPPAPQGSRVSSAPIVVFSTNPDEGEGKGKTGRGGGNSIQVPGSIMFQHQDFVPRMFDLANALKYIPGNKSLLLFSSRNLGPTAEKLGQEFANASTPVYTINTQNWRVDGVINLSVKKKYIWKNHPLEKMSTASGGKYFADIEDVETISRDVHQLTGNYYVLGYYIPDTWDGKYHKIEVKVDNPDLHVLAQDGFFNPKPYNQFSEFEKKLHLYDLVYTTKPETLVPYEILTEPLFIAGQEEMNCALLTQIAVDEKAGIPPAEAEIYAFVFDDEYEAVLMKQGEMDLTPFDRQSLFAYFTAQLPTGKYECRIIIRDKETGQAAVGKIEFTFPEQEETGITLSSPLVFAEGPDSVLLKLTEEKKKRDRGPSLGSLYRFRPKNHGLVVRNLHAGIRNFLAVLPVKVDEGLVSEAEISVRLYPEPEGEPLELRTEIVDIQKVDANTNILVMNIQLPEIKFGEYELEFEVFEKISLTRSFVRKILVIK